MFIKSRIENNYHLVKHKSGKIINKRFDKTLYLFQCDGCECQFERSPNNIGSKKRLSNEFKHFCKTCFSYGMAADLGKANYRKTLDKRIGERKVDSCGYMTIYVGDTHPYSNGYCGREREHILVMENHLKRKMKKGEVVHHLDGNKLNNSIDNLDLCTVQQHNNCHAKSEEIVFKLYAKGLVSYDRETKLYFLKD